jgi:predicted component of type VI protein secretion system
VEVEADVVIGREEADLTIPDEEISRRHAVVRPVERGVVVEDLGSLNGTFINGKQISEPVTITLGSTLRVGASDIEIEIELAAPTKVREVVPAGEPTVARAVPPSPPPVPPAPAAEAAEQQPPAEPAPAKPPPGGPRGPAPPPRYGGPSESERSGPPKPALIAGVVLAVAIVVVLALLLL